MTQQIVKSVIVKQTVAQVYNLWSNFENFPYFMEYVRSVNKTGPDTSHWEVDGPLGMTVEWDAEMTRRDDNKRIGWNSKDRDGTVVTSGQVTFNELPQGETEVTIMMRVTPPAGKVGEIIGELFSNPDKRVEADLRNFKRHAESLSSRPNPMNPM